VGCGGVLGFRIYKGLGVRVKFWMRLVGFQGCDGVRVKGWKCSMGVKGVMEWNMGL
jgi:hypothetical protein